MPGNEVIDITPVIASIKQAREIISGGNVDPEQQKILLQECERLCSQLKPASQRVYELNLAWAEMVAVKIAIDMGIFQLTSGVGVESKCFTVKEIATSLDADPMLVERIMRSLVATGLFTAHSTGNYTPVPSAAEFTFGRPMTDRVNFTYDISLLAGQKLPKYLANTKYRLPQDPNSGPFQYAFETEQHIYAWLQQQPSLQASFNRFMQSGRMVHSQRWYDIYPISDRFSTSQGPIQLVDIGGGIGQDIRGLLNRFPDMKGHFTLQDSPEVVNEMLEELKTPPGAGQVVQGIAHDFFQPQPIKGAQIYHIGRVLHNWPNPMAHKILRHTQEAMAADSVLLLYEQVLPDSADMISPMDTRLDIVMMVLMAGTQRSEAQFRELLNSAGLRLVRTWKPDGDDQSRQRVMEVVKEKASIF